MEREEKEEKVNERINRFIIECMFNKYFEGEREIASPRRNVGTRNDDSIEIVSSLRSSQ